jgi:hypothetical protein
VTVQSPPAILGTSISSSPFHVQGSSPYHDPALLHKYDTSASNHTVTRQSSSYPTSIPPNRTTSRRVSTPPDSKLSGMTTTTSEDASAARGRPVRQPISSLGTRIRDSRALYPSTTSYLYADERDSDEWQPAGVVMPVRPDLEAPNPSGVRRSPNDIGGRSVLSSGDPRSDIHDRFESREVHLPYPPGLEQYTQNLQNIPVGPTHPGSHHRRSNGEQVLMSSERPAVVDQVYPSSASPTRCVRWNEDLICPSPILSSQRRKGWYNRRGYVPFVTFPNMTNTPFVAATNYGPMMEHINHQLKARNILRTLMATRNLMSGGKTKKGCGLIWGTGLFLNSQCAPL